MENAHCRDTDYFFLVFCTSQSFMTSQHSSVVKWAKLYVHLISPLELRQYKNDSIQSKKFQFWNCRAFSPLLRCEKKRGNFKIRIRFDWRSLPYIVFALVPFNGWFSQKFYSNIFVVFYTHFISKRRYFSEVLKEIFERNLVYTIKLLCIIPSGNRISSFWRIENLYFCSSSPVCLSLSIKTMG